jgi:hypothetical protein
MILKIVQEMPTILNLIKKNILTLISSQLLHLDFGFYFYLGGNLALPTVDVLQNLLLLHRVRNYREEYVNSFKSWLSRKY